MAETLAILALISRVVALLEGPGGELLRNLTEMAKGAASGTPLTPDELEYLRVQANAAVERAHLSLTRGESGGG